jgi:predicted nucleotidyltransferase
LSPLETHISTTLSERLNDLEGLYLFGSRANGSFSTQSDWDFAFLSRKGLPELELWEMKSSIESLFDVEIDLIDLYKESTVLQWEVLKTGIMINSKNAMAVATFEYLTMSFYQKLEEERADIMKDIAQRGSVY